MAIFTSETCGEIVAEKVAQNCKILESTYLVEKCLSNLESLNLAPCVCVYKYGYM